MMNDRRTRMMDAGKMGVLEALKDAIKSVDDAVGVIEHVAGELGIKPEEKRVGLWGLAGMVAGKTGQKPGCVYDALVCAFGLIEDLGLTLVMEGEDDEE